MTRAQPDQPQGRPYPPNSGDAPPYPTVGSGYGAPGYPASITSPADADTTAIPRDPGAGYGDGPGVPGYVDGPIGIGYADGPGEPNAVQPSASVAPAGDAAFSAPPANSSPTAAPRKHSRVGAAWVAVVVAAIVLIFFLIFILQNSDQVQVEYLGWAGTLSLGVAMLFAAIAGALTVGLLGSVRILQLRKRAKRAGG